MNGFWWSVRFRIGSAGSNCRSTLILKKRNLFCAIIPGRKHMPLSDRMKYGSSGSGEYAVPAIISDKETMIYSAAALTVIHTLKEKSIGNVFRTRRQCCSIVPTCSCLSS